MIGGYSKLTAKTIRPSKFARLLVLALVAAHLLMKALAIFFTPVMLRAAPLLLVAMDAASHQILLVHGEVAAAALITVAVLRRTATACLYFSLGWWYGDSAVDWIKHRGGGGRRAICIVEQAFTHVSWLAVLLYPGAIVAILAGTRRMRPCRFIVLTLTNSVGTVVVLGVVASATTHQLMGLREFSNHHIGWLTVVAGAAATFALAWEWRRGSTRLMAAKSESATSAMRVARYDQLDFEEHATLIEK